MRNWIAVKMVARKIRIRRGAVKIVTRKIRGRKRITMKNLLWGLEESLYGMFHSVYVKSTLNRVYSVCMAIGFWSTTWYRKWGRYLNECEIPHGLKLSSVYSITVLEIMVKCQTFYDQNCVGFFRQKTS